MSWMQQVFGKNWLTTFAGALGIIAGALKVYPAQPQNKASLVWFGDLLLSLSVGGIGLTAMSATNVTKRRASRKKKKEEPKP